MLIKLGYSSMKWKDGIKSSLFWNTEKVPHIMISGITGGGKTVLSQTILNQLLSSEKDIAICDYKAGGDWNGIVPKYAEFSECDIVLNDFYETFTEAIRNKDCKDKYLIFDEFTSYALSKDAKEFKELMSKISHLAFMGRSFGYHLVFISQQFNSKVIDTAIREQFGIKIYMGSTISTESATMLFPNCEINKSQHLPECCGYISLPEQDLEIIQVPYINEPKKLKLLLIQKSQALY